MNELSLHAYVKTQGAIRRLRDRVVDDRGEFTVSWMVIVVVVIAAAVTAIAAWKLLFDAEKTKLDAITT